MNWGSKPNNCQVAAPSHISTLEYYNPAMGNYRGGGKRPFFGGAAPPNLLQSIPTSAAFPPCILCFCLKPTQNFSPLLLLRLAVVVVTLIRRERKIRDLFPLHSRRIGANLKSHHLRARKVINCFCSRRGCFQILSPLYLSLSSQISFFGL